MTYPWRIIISPAATWQLLRRQPQWYWALATHWALIFAGWMISATSMRDLTIVAGYSSPAQRQGILSHVLSAILLLAVIAIMAAVATGICAGLLRVIGKRAGFSTVLTWFLYGMLPWSMGALLSYLLFAIVKPLATTPAQALALIIKPYSLGLAAFLPGTTQPLSFGWFVFSYLDIFGIWSIILLIFGAIHFLQLSVRKTLWLTLGLMLLSFALITGLWNAAQNLLLR